MEVGDVKEDIANLEKRLTEQIGFAIDKLGTVRESEKIRR